MKNRTFRLFVASTLTALALAACSKDKDGPSVDDDDGGPPGNGGSDGTGGQGTQTGGASSSIGGTSIGGAGTGGSGGTTSMGGESGSLVVIAQGQNSPTGIALLNDDVYWANRDSGSIVRCPKTGCNGSDPVEIVTNQNGPRGISTSATHLYWTDSPDDLGGSVLLKGCELDNCVPELLGSTPEPSGTATDVHFDGGTLYYGAWPNMGACDADSCLPDEQVLLDRAPVVSVATDDAFLYSSRHGWGQVSRCELPACTTITPLVELNTPLGLAVRGDEMYFGRHDLSSLGMGGGSSAPTIFKCGSSGCDLTDAEVVQEGDISPFALAIDGDRLYFTNVNHGTVVSVPR